MQSTIDAKIINDDPLKNYDWVVFGTATCPYCKKAKEKLIKNNLSGVYISLSDEYGRVQTNNNKYFSSNKKIKAEIDRYTDGKGYNYVPMIFHKGKFIGGFTELENLV